MMSSCTVCMQVRLHELHSLIYVVTRGWRIIVYSSFPSSLLSRLSEALNQCVMRACMCLPQTYLIGHRVLWPRGSIEKSLCQVVEWMDEQGDRCVHLFAGERRRYLRKERSR